MQYRIRIVFAAMIVCVLSCPSRSIAQFAPDITKQSADGVARAPLVYDITTVKPNVSGSGKLDIWVDENTWRAVNVSPRVLLGAAFNVDGNLIFGLPGWADQVRYDITAKVSDAEPDALHAIPEVDRRTMLQRLLADRFGMQAHMERRQEKALELVQLQPPRSAKGLRPAGQGSPPDLEAVRGAQAPGTHLLAHRDVELRTLIEELSVQLHSPVIDRTQMAGRWDIDLSWLRENAPPSAEANMPSDLFAAVREQLGLELRGIRAEVPVLIVDRWLRPGEN